MPDDTRRRRILQEYNETQERQQSSTQRFPTLQQAPQVQIVPVERPVCPAHSGVEVRLAHLEIAQGEDRAEIRRLRMLPWKVVGAALGAGGGIAGIIEVLRWIFSSG